MSAGRLLLWLDERREEMVTLLERLVEAESPSADVAAQAAVFGILAAELDRIDYAVRHVPGTVSGDHLYARPRRRRRGDPHQLVVGHMDTVWPIGTLARMPVRREQGLLFGPGTADMKGGLVEIVFALRALRELDLPPPATPVVLVNSDEEIGSVDSTLIIQRLARAAARAFVLESGEGPEGNLKIARKGLGRFTVTIRGRPAHAGADPEQGVSAILELSHQVQRLFELNDPAQGITVNVGMIDGGLQPNVVAPQATAVVDVRVPTTIAGREIERALRELTPVLEGTTIEIDGEFRRPPMEPLPRNRGLLAAAKRLGYELGIPLEDAGLVGGGSDANTISVYTATLDGLGPIGDGSHAVDERIDTTTLPERTALLTLLLLAPLDHPAIARSRRRAGRKLAPTSTRVYLVGTDASGTNVEIAAAWHALGIDAVLTAAAEATREQRPTDVVLGRLDILPTMLSVEPGLLGLLLLERRGARVLNPAFALAAAHDKLLTARLLTAAGLPHPRTEHLRRAADPTTLEPPLVLKPRLGSWGLDVFRCDTPGELRLRLEEIDARPWFRRHGVLVQELVPPAGQDLRVLVAGGRVVGAVRRTAGPGEWRTNVSLGGTKAAIVPPPAAASLALAAASALHIDLASVDLLPSGDAFAVIEVNGAADFNDTYSLPGRDVFQTAAAALGLLPNCHPPP